MLFVFMTIEIPLKIIPIEEDGFHLMVKAGINHHFANLLIDTGASKTVFDFKRIHKFEENIAPVLQEKLSTGLGTNSMQIHLAQVKLFALGDLELTDFEVVLLDLSHVNQSYETIAIEQIDGVIGSDLLCRYDAVIDFKNKVLRIES